MQRTSAPSQHHPRPLSNDQRLWPHQLPRARVKKGSTHASGEREGSRGGMEGAGKGKRGGATSRNKENGRTPICTRAVRERPQSAPEAPEPPPEPPPRLTGVHRSSSEFIGSSSVVHR
eukprot:3984589-Pyramimonas_sp.AAC.1